MTLQELQDKRLTIAAAIRAANEKLEKMPGDAAAKSEWEAANAAYDANETARKAAIAAKEESDARQTKLKEIEDSIKESTNHRRIGLDDSERRQREPERIEENRVADHAMALQGWMRYQSGQDIEPRQLEACKRAGISPQAKEVSLGMVPYRGSEPRWNSGPKELRAGMDVATSGAGKETIPHGFMGELSQRLVQYGGPYGVCRIVKTASGNSMPWPTVNDTSNEAAVLAEATTISTSVDPTFAAVTFGAYKLWSKPIFASAEILQDSYFNLAVEIGGLMGIRFGRGLGTLTTTGSGSSTLTGIVTASTAGVTAASATAFTADELIDLYHAVNPAWRASPSFGFMANDAPVKFARKLKDANGQYLWQSGLQAGRPDTLLGAPLTINQHMASAMTTGQKVFLAGDFSQFIIREAGDMRLKRLDERYADTDQVAFVGFARYDSNTIQATALQRLTLA